MPGTAFRAKMWSSPRRGDTLCVRGARLYMQVYEIYVAVGAHVGGTRLGDTSVRCSLPVNVLRYGGILIFVNALIAECANDTKRPISHRRGSTIRVWRSRAHRNTEAAC